jgi:hypothetical protein
MPAFIFSQALTANQTGYNPLSGWQYETLPYPAAISIMVRGTTTGCRQQIFTGSQNIMQRCPVQGGGTAGTTPSQLNTPVIAFNGAAQDKLQLLIDEVAGGTPTVDGIIYIEPLA